jgi:hypothetical protein
MYTDVHIGRCVVGMPRAEYQTRLTLESPELMSMGLKTFQHSYAENSLGIQSWHEPDSPLLGPHS